MAVRPKLVPVGTGDATTVPAGVELATLLGLPAPAANIISIPGALLRGQKGEISACEFNALVLFSESAQWTGLHYDEFLGRVRLDDRDWTDHDDRTALCWLQATYQVPRFSLGHARNATAALAMSRRRDSLTEWFDALPEWDGTPRIAFAFEDAWGADSNPLTRAASANLFVAAAARCRTPGAKVDTLWAFEGPQGAFKSEALHELGGTFHAEISASVGTTDFQREVQGLLIAELSEMDALRGREASTVKRLLSARADRFVDKYDKHATTYQRRAVFVATTNEANYWQDATGARRLVPIKVGKINLENIRMNRLQWFAEAKQELADGATWWDFPASIRTEQDDRQQVDAWEDLLRSLKRAGRRERDGVNAAGDPVFALVPWPDDWIASAEVMRLWLRLEPHQQGRESSTRLGRVMRRLGYRPAKRSGDRGWEPGHLDVIN